MENSMSITAYICRAIPSARIATTKCRNVTRFFGKTAVVLGGETAMEKAKPALLKGVEGSDVELLGFLPYGGDSTYENGDALIANPLVQKAT